MRAIGSSLLAAVLLVGCGAKPELHETTPPPAGSLQYLAVQKQVSLQLSAAKAGEALKLTVSPNGDIFVLDSDHHRIYRFAADGSLLREAGGRGTGPLQFNNPIDFDCDGLALWVLDRQNQRLVRVDLALNFVEELPLDPTPGDPTSALWYDAVAASVSGEIILLDRAEPRAVMIAPDGSVITSYGGFGLGIGRMNDPTALAAALDGTVYAADGTELLQYDRNGNHRKTYVVNSAIADVAAGESAAWVLTRDRRIHTVHKGELRATAMDPQASYLEPVAIAVNRNGDLVVLDRELSVWLLAPPAP